MDLRTVVECAELAPSLHNTQPWTCRVVGDTVEIRADRTRALLVVDPQGRELTVSCGAAVEFAYTAMRGLGWDCTTRLLPDPDDDDLLAIVEVGARRATGPDESALYDAIPRRYTDRGGYEATVLAPELRDALDRGVGARGAWLRILDRDGDRLAVIQALSNAEAAEAADPAVREELADWLRSGSSPDGIPPAALGDLAASGRVSDVPLRDFTGANQHPHPGGDGAPPAVERDMLLMIGTTDDTPLSWLQAGRALGWLLLRLTVEGLSSQPLGQALDVEISRLRLAREIGLIGHVQFLLRTGDGHGKPTTGRRHASMS